jgi:monoamine oxidase
LGFEPPPDPRREAAVAACGSGRAVKLGLLFEEPWWQARGFSGRIHGEGLLQDLWDGARSDAPILCVYACGEAAVALAREADPPMRAVDALSRHFPEAARAYRRGWIHDWTTDPRALGVHSHFPAGYVLDHLPHVARPEGRVHFAGEHTSSWNGFLEGALDSAERVAAELLRVRGERASA